MRCVAVEDDAVLRLAGIVLDPATPPERVAAFQDYFRHDLPDLEAWCADLRKRLPRLYPARVALVRDQAGLRAALPDADAAIVEERAIGPEELALAPKLRCVQVFGSGTRDVDAAACAARGIEIRTLRRRTNIAVAEHALALLLALSKRLPAIGGAVSDKRLVAAGFSPAPFDRRHTAGANWGRVAGLRTLHGATLGLLGFGEIGRELATMANGLGMRVLVTQRTRLTPEQEREARVTWAPMDDMLRHADAISIHVPGDRKGLVDAAAIAKMKPGALLINTSRAAVVERDALLAALRSGQIGGAGLDVHDAEPVPPDDPFLTLPTALLTPHLAGGSRHNGLADMAEMLTGLEAALATDQG